MNLERLRDSLDVISPQNIADMKLELKYATYTDQVKLYNRFIVFNFIGLRVGNKIRLLLIKISFTVLKDSSLHQILQLHNIM